MTPPLALVAFALLTMTAITIEIVYAYATQGFGYGFSSNRPAVSKPPLGLRIERAYRNQVEASAYVVPVLAAAAVVGLGGADISLAALIVVAGRAWFVLTYYIGLPFLRIPGFSATALATLYIAVQLLTATVA